jgi:hypothetical protein
VKAGVGHHRLALVRRRETPGEITSIAKAGVAGGVADDDDETLASFVEAAMSFGDQSRSDTAILPPQLRAVTICQGLSISQATATRAAPNGLATKAPATLAATSGATYSFFM